MEDQVIRHDENKWGNKLSSKLFMAREFVVKHVRNKHGHVLEAERERLQDLVRRLRAAVGAVVQQQWWGRVGSSVAGTASAACCLASAASSRVGAAWCAPFPSHLVQPALAVI